ncbi:MAG: hypothetical protein ABID67_02050 [Candidatus Nealsonbacteria bacterium]
MKILVVPPILYDLEEINSSFVELEEKTNNNRINPSEAREIVKKLIPSLISIIKRAIEENWGKEEIRAKLRDTWRIHGESSFIKHLQEWPYGFMGDFVAINNIVDKKELSEHPLGSILGEYALESPIAQQHREKIRIQAALIETICQKREEAIIVSAAAGASRDIELVQDIIKKTGAKIYLIDSDQNALIDSIARLEKIKNQIETRTVNVFTLPKFLKSLVENGQNPDLVFAGGLLDYLNNKLATQFVRMVWDQLKGQDSLFMFTNIAEGNPFRPWIETMANWKLIERSEKEMRELSNLGNSKHQSLEKDPTGLTWIVKASDNSDCFK